MDKILKELAKRVGPEFRAIDPPETATGRPSTTAVYASLKKARGIIRKRFGNPILCRYSGCVEDLDKKYSRSGRVFEVLEYLWDFSFSRFAIPQAIEDFEAKPIPANQRYELLFVAESELGTKDEICRDLLKLLEARSRIRCLVFRQQKRDGARKEFKARMMRVLRNHAQFHTDPGLWFLVGLTWGTEKVDCEFYTLRDDFADIVAIPITAAST